MVEITARLLMMKGERLREGGDSKCRHSFKKNLKDSR